MSIKLDGFEKVENHGRFIGPYWKLGINQESYNVDRMYVKGKEAVAYCSVANPYQSTYADAGPWHLQVIVAQALAYEAICVHAHLDSGLTEKSTETWMNAVDITAHRPVTVSTGIEIKLSIITRLYMPPTEKRPFPRSYITWKVGFCDEAFFGKFVATFNFAPKEYRTR